MNARTAHPPRRSHLRSHPSIVVAGLTALALVAAEPARAQAPPAAPGAPPAFDCRATQTLGVPEADVATTVSIICDELARVSGREGTYGVAVRPLGKALILSVSRLPQGDTRTLTLEGLEETPLAATRLAEALVLGRPVEKTQRVDNLTALETRQPHEKKGSRKFTLGVVGLGMPGQGVRTGSGFSFGLSHETPSWAAVGEYRYARGPGNEDRASLSSLSAGVRRYLSRRDIAPYLAGGMEYLWLEIWHNDREGSGSTDGTSLAAYLEAGVQVMRLSRARVTAGIRLHLPTASLEGETYDWHTCDGDDYYLCDIPPERRRTSEYVVPVTFALSVSF